MTKAPSWLSRRVPAGIRSHDDIGRRGSLPEAARYFAADMVAEELYVRLDRARLDRTLLERALAAAPKRLEAFVEAHRRFGAAGDVAPLERAAQRLIDLFCDEFVLARKRLSLRNEPRPHRRRGGRIVCELHGRCAMHGPIEIFVRTAARGQPVALRSLLQTLLHEFVHHHDFDAFRASVHCGGFYERLGQLDRPLRDRLP
jgi:hypothetical protein